MIISIFFKISGVTFLAIVLLDLLDVVPAGSGLVLPVFLHAKLAPEALLVVHLRRVVLHLHDVLVTLGTFIHSAKFKSFIYIQHILYYNIYITKNAYTILRCMDLLNISFYRSTKTEII